jgi:DNA-binding beta-propeller fold protein YncE
LSRLATAVLALAAALLLAAPVAQAAGGALTELPGPGGCLLDTSTGDSPGTCSPATAISDGNGVALAPDGRNLYVTSGDDSSVSVINRDPNTGAIAQAGCLSSGGPLPGAATCSPARRLSGASSAVVSPDGRFVYVTSSFGRSITAFARDPATGALTQLEGTAGCVARSAADCMRDSRLGPLYGIVMAPDGQNLYAVGNNRVLSLGRDPASGQLQLIPNSGCVANHAVPGCDAGRGLDQAIGLALSPDGKSLYVASYASKAVALIRVTGGWSLSQPHGRAGCWSSAHRLGGCAPARGLPDAQRAAVSPDGRNVYVVSRDPTAVALFKRKAGGGLSQLAGRRGCIGAKGCAKAVGLSGGSGVAVSPDNRNVYVTTDYTDAVLSFSRGAGGTLTQLRGPGGCIVDQTDKQKGCARAARALLDNPEAIALTPDGRYAYVAAGGVDAFARS